MHTRPDLSYAVSKLSQYLSNPSVHHIQVAKHVMRYLKGSLDLGIHFAPSGNATPLGYSSQSPPPFKFINASHTADPDDCKSHSGNLFFHNGGIISHSPGKQPVALNTDSEGALNHTKNNINHALNIMILRIDVLRPGMIDVPRMNEGRF